MTVTTWLPPGATLREAGATAYSALVPDARASVPVNVALPVFDTVKVFADDAPTVTLPNASDAGLTAIFGAAGTTPVPLTARFVVGPFVAFEVSARQPESVPAPVGE